MSLPTSLAAPSAPAPASRPSSSPCKAAPTMLAALAVALAFMPSLVIAATPSPGDWRDQVIYQLLTDRFYDGDPSNNNAEGAYRPDDPRGVHGGDWKGIEKKLDYIKSLGATAIWISPVPINKNGAYHAYAAKDFYGYSPEFGGLKDLRSMIDAAHAKGMRVIIDIVCNHTADFITSRDPGFPAYRDAGGYHMEFRQTTDTQAAPFNNLAWYHSNGRIDNNSSRSVVLGELSNLDDLRTELPEVQQELIKAYEKLITETDCDGFRIDTAKHVGHDFWRAWFPAINKHAASLGKANFLAFGEAWDGKDEFVGSFTGTRSSNGAGAFEFNSMLYYPMYYTTRDVFVNREATSKISERLAALTNYDPATTGQLVTFLDNHDVPRWLGATWADGDQQRLRLALAFQLLTVGVPCVYYGTEQGFEGDRRGGRDNDPYDREDMFAGQFEFGASVGDNFNETHPLYLYVQRLLNLRRHYHSLRQGRQVERANSPGAGLYAFSRIDGVEETLVALNTSDSTLHNVSIKTDMKPGEKFITLLATSDRMGASAASASTDAASGPASVDNSQAGVVGDGGNVTVTLPGSTAIVLSPWRQLGYLDPTVVDITPRHDARGVSPRDARVRVAFSEPMEPESVRKAFAIQPPISFEMTQASPEAYVFKLTGELQREAEYHVSIAASATSAHGVPMAAAFESAFHAAQGRGRRR